MRFIQTSHVFFFISIVLHGSLLSLFVSGSFDLKSAPEPIQATIVFEPAPAPKPVLDLQKKEVSKTVVNTTKPLEKPTLQTKANIKTSLSNAPLTRTSVSERSIDDLLQNQKPVLQKKPLTTEAPEIKKTDLLGYLRATKRTQQKSALSDPKTPEAPQKTPKTSEPETPKNPDLITEVKKSPKPKQDKAPAPASITQRENENDPLFPGSQRDASRDQENNLLSNGHGTAQLRKWKKDNEIKTYRSQLAYLISSNWTKVVTKEFQILVQATIDEYGNLIDVKVVKGSGLAGMDATAISAIRKSTPFPRLPDAYKPKKQVTLVFRFTPDNVIY